MLKPTFTEKTALEIRERIIARLRKHFHDPASWYGPHYSAIEPRKHFSYEFPRVSDFADVSFDDVSESVFLRVLKDMNNLGTIILRRSAGRGMADSEVVLPIRFLTPLPAGVSGGKGGYRCTAPDLSVLST
ncbi:MAG: hypothetical protein WBQ07_21705 [Candidatus Acidiferrales bacterium]